MIPRLLCALVFSGFILTSLQDCPKEPAKNWALLELATIGESKLLFCQVIDECQVSWKKDGKDFPSSDKYEYRCGGRELVFKSINKTDAGNYTCIAEGCNDPDPQTLELRVYPADESRAPINTQYTHSTCKDEEASIGENVTFCCVFNVGNLTSLQKSLSFTVWYNETGSIGNLTDKDATSLIPYNNSTEMATCISIVNVTKERYGNYTVRCNNGIDPIAQEILRLLPPAPPQDAKPAWYYPVIGAIIAVAMATILAALVYKQNRVEIQLVLKDRFGAKEQNDGKLYDTYISYYWSDTELNHNPDRLYAIDLNQRLTKLGYKVCLGERDFLPGSVTSEEISRCLRESRRYIILLSPEFLTYRYMSHETDQCLDIVKKNKKHIIPLFLRDVEQDVIEKRTILNHILRSHPRLDWRVFEDAMPSDPIRTNSMENGTAIEMNDEASGNGAIPQRKLKKGDERVWKTIRLQMPPIPRHTARSSYIADGLTSSPERDMLVGNGHNI